MCSRISSMDLKLFKSHQVFLDFLPNQLEFYQSQLPTFIFLDNVKVTMKLTISYLCTLTSRLYDYLNLKKIAVDSLIGYIQQTDHKATCLKAESISFNVRPCRKMTTYFSLQLLIHKKKKSALNFCCTHAEKLHCLKF